MIFKHFPSFSLGQHGFFIPGCPMKLIHNIKFPGDTFTWLQKAAWLYFSQGYSLEFFLIFAFMVVWGLRFLVWNWVFWVGVFSWWGFGPVVWGHLGFFGVDALHINIKEKPLEKRNFAAACYNRQGFCGKSASKMLLYCIQSIALHRGMVDIEYSFVTLSCSYSNSTKACLAVHLATNKISKHIVYAEEVNLEHHV